MIGRQNIFHLPRWIGFKNAIVFILFYIFKLQKEILVNFVGDQIFLRTSTPDLITAIEFLIKGIDEINCNNPSVIIDAGAYIGVSSISFTKKFPNAKIYAIEPERENFEILRKNVRDYPNIIPINAALFGEVGERIIQDRFTGPWGYTILDTVNSKSATDQLIDCITIDSLIAEYGIDTIDLLKLDIEGGEKSVFENSENWIEKTSVIYIELHDHIIFGCGKAFYLATRNFEYFWKGSGEKITAYRKLSISGTVN